MAGKKKRKGSKTIVNLVLGVICFIWLLPTLGLFISSFRPAADILQTGRWKVFPHQAWTQVDTPRLSKDPD
ncbi:sugar ABC transporter permease, partial [Paenibacillus riograndensis]